jgi:alkyl hydroperoxide reductase subunit AhpC
MKLKIDVANLKSREKNSILSPKKSLTFHPTNPANKTFSSVQAKVFNFIPSTFFFFFAAHLSHHIKQLMKFAVRKVNLVTVSSNNNQQHEQQRET